VIQKMPLHERALIRIPLCGTIDEFKSNPERIFPRDHGENGQLRAGRAELPRAASSQTQPRVLERRALISSISPRIRTSGPACPAGIRKSSRCSGPGSKNRATRPLPRTFRLTTRPQVLSHRKSGANHPGGNDADPSGSRRHGSCDLRLRRLNERQHVLQGRVALDRVRWGEDVAAVFSQFQQALRFRDHVLPRAERQGFLDG
jgi:hypothetical protein